MKHLSIKLLLAVTAIAISANLFATNPNESVNSNTATLVEIDAIVTLVQESNWIESLLEIQLLSLDERKMKVIVEDADSNTTATTSFLIVSNDGLDELGPFTISEGDILSVTVDQRDWSIQEILSSYNSVITSWYEMQQ